MENPDNKKLSAESQSMQAVSSKFGVASSTWAKYSKKMFSKDKVTQDLMAGTYETALQVLARIDGVPFYELSMSVFVYCKDETCRFISKDFEACLELAGIAPEKFILGLHSFYNNLSAKLRKPGMSIAFSQFIHTFMRLRYDKTNKGINYDVILAYTDLILNMLYYIRPKKLDNTRNLAGVSIDGMLLPAQNRFPFIRLANFRLMEKLISVGANWNWSDFSDYGFSINSEEELKNVFRENRMYENITATMLPFINEYTYDIVSNMTAPTIKEGHQFYQIKVALSELESDLTARKRTLPINGVEIKFDDAGEWLQSLLIKEIAMYGQVYLLYRLRVSTGDICGYYATKTRFFYNLLLDTKEHSEVSHKIFDFLKGTILFLYAAYVRADKYHYDKFKDIAHIFFTEIDIKHFPIGGALANVYAKSSNQISPNEPKRKNLEAKCLEKQNVMVNGYIRRLPDGQRASQAAQEMALRLGYDLAPNETYVSPFIKRIFKLKNDEDD